MSSLIRFSCALLLCTLGACGRQSATPATAVEGTVNVNPAVPLGAEARIELQLMDVTGVDGTSMEIAAATVRTAMLPYRYTLPFDAGRIDATHRYTVAARLFIGESLRFATDSAFPVLTQGNDRHRDLVLNATGGNPAVTTPPSSDANNDVVLRGELRSGNDRSIWSAGLRQNALNWIEEDRGSDKGVVHARYEFRGGYVLKYVDSSPLDIQFDEHGKPVAVTRNGRQLQVNDAMDFINTVRNRASMLRSDVLAVSEAREHRAATDAAAAPSGAMALRP